MLLKANAGEPAEPPKENYYDGVFAQLCNVFRGPDERKLTASDCKGWHAEPFRFKELKEVASLYNFGDLCV